MKLKLHSPKILPTATPRVHKLIMKQFSGQAFQPEFAEPLMNLTVPIGRDATFRCLVQNLGGYRVSYKQKKKQNI